MLLKVIVWSALRFLLWQHELYILYFLEDMYTVAQRAQHTATTRDQNYFI